MTAGVLRFIKPMTSTKDGMEKTREEFVSRVFMYTKSIFMMHQVHL